MNSGNIQPVNSRGNAYFAQLESTDRKELKDTDILVFSRIGATSIAGKDGNPLKGGLFKSSSSGFFNNLFKYKARKADVLAIFRTAGMSKTDADNALRNVTETSKKQGISGLSAKAVKAQVENYQKEERKTDNRR
ncbi:MAG: hypothetical protein RI928_2329 [Pseudomonadota bacterium]|jgi:hypothetical protein